MVRICSRNTLELRRGETCEVHRRVVNSTTPCFNPTFREQELSGSGREGCFKCVVEVGKLTPNLHGILKLTPNLHGILGAQALSETVRGKLDQTREGLLKDGLLKTNLDWTGCEPLAAVERTWHI